MRFRGSVVSSFVSNGWFLDSLAVAADRIRFKSFGSESVIERVEVKAVEFHAQRLPLLFRTFVVFRLRDGMAHARIFIPWRRRGLRRALEQHGWQIEDRKVTFRQMLASPRP